MIVDIYEEGGETKRRLLGYELTPAGYMEMVPNARGWLWLEPVGLWLGLQGRQVVCYDAEGNPIEGYTRMMAAHAEAEARTRQLEAELRRLRGEEDN